MASKSASLTSVAVEFNATQGLVVGSTEATIGDTGEVFGGPQNCTIHGDLIVHGKTQTTNSTIVTIADKNIQLAKVTSSLKTTNNAADAFSDLTPTTSGTITNSQTNVNGKVKSIAAGSGALNDQANNYNTHADFGGDGQLVITYDTNGSGAVTVDGITSPGGFLAVGNTITVEDAGGGTFDLTVKSGGVIASGLSDENLSGAGITIVSGEASADDKTILYQQDTDAFEINQHWLPSANDSFNLGSASQRWQNVFTMDLHLANERGDWTLVEEANYLTVRNNKNGKRYKLLMEELPDDED